MLNKVGLHREREREREADEEDLWSDQVVVAPFYPARKTESWFLVVGEPSTKTLLSIKRVTVQKRINRKLEFNLAKGDHGERGRHTPDVTELTLASI